MSHKLTFVSHTSKLKTDFADLLDSTVGVLSKVFRSSEVKSFQVKKTLSFEMGWLPGPTETTTKKIDRRKTMIAVSRLQGCWLGKVGVLVGLTHPFNEVSRTLVLGFCVSRHCPSKSTLQKRNRKNRKD